MDSFHCWLRRLLAAAVQNIAVDPFLVKLGLSVWIAAISVIHSFTTKEYFVLLLLHLLLQHVHTYE